MAVDSYWQKYVHEALVNHFGGLSLPRKSVIRLTDRPDMTSAVYVDVKQQHNNNNNKALVELAKSIPVLFNIVFRPLLLSTVSSFFHLLYPAEMSLLVQKLASVT